MSIEHALRNLEEDKLTEKQLLSLLSNAMRFNNTTLVEKIKLKLRIKHPRAANKVFGTREKDASAKLEDTYTKIAEKHKLSGNHVKNKVKAGGPMKSGVQYICLYISYKNKEGQSCALILNQETVDSELYCMVKEYLVGDDSQTKETRYDMGQYEEAVQHYISLLEPLVGESHNE